MKKLEDFCKSFVLYLIMIILFLLIILGLIYTTNITGYEEVANITKVSFISLILMIILCLIYIVFCKKIKNTKINKKLILPILLILYIMMNIYWINQANVSPIDDAASVQKVAVAIVENNTKVLKSNSYLEKCPQQIGMAVIFSIIYKIFNSTNYRIIQYLNILANVLTILGLYKITKKLDKNNHFNDLIYLSLILTFVPLTLLTTYVYSDYIGLSLIVWSIYFIMNYKENNKTKNIIVSAILMDVACIMKTNYLVSFIAVIIYLILNIINNHKNLIKKIGLIIIYIILVLGPYIILKNTVSAKLNLTATESIPTSGYIYIGMSESTRGPGWYGVAVLPAWEDATKSRKVYPTLIKNRIKEFIDNPVYCLNFYKEKIISGWEDPYFQSVWYNLISGTETVYWDEIPTGNKFQVIQLGMKCLLLLIYSFTFIYALLNRKNINLNSILLSTIFIGGFLFHILWEMKSRYTLPYVIIIIPLATLGISQFIECITNSKKLKKVLNNKFKRNNTKSEFV